VKVQLTVDGIQIHSDEFDYSPSADKECSGTEFDLFAYTLPACVRRLLKITKLFEIQEIITTDKARVSDHFDNPMFPLDSLANFQHEAVIKFQLMKMEQVRLEIIWDIERIPLPVANC